MNSVTELEQRLKKSFKFFLACVWKELNLPPPTRAQNAIADYLQYGPKRLQIQAFRGVGKSYVACCFVLWCLYVNKDIKILLVSASKERADNNSIFIQKLITSITWLNHLEPRNDDLRWSRVSFDVQGCTPTQAPSVKSVGITGTITGSRADIILFDDVEVPNNSDTDLQRQKLMQLITEGESVLIPLDTSRIIFLGTPQTTFTVYRKLAERNYLPMVWPARYPERPELYDNQLAKDLVDDIARGLGATGAPTDDRFSDVELLEREASMGRSNFELQFQLNTTLSDAEKFPLHFSDFIVTPLSDCCAEKYTWSSDPRYVIKDLPAVGLPGDRWHRPMFIEEGSVPYTETILAVDPSGRGADETVAWIISQANGYLFLRDMKAYRDGYSDETLTDILRLGKKYGATTAIVESNFGDGIICELMRKHAIQMGYNVDIQEERATTQKESRIIDTLEPPLNQHRLVLDPKIIEYDYRSNPTEAPDKRLEYMLGYQISRMCREKGAVRHDDRIDALALGVKYFTEAFVLSEHKEAAQRRAEEFSALRQLAEEEGSLLADAFALGWSFKATLDRKGGGRGRVFSYTANRR